MDPGHTAAPPPPPARTSSLGPVQLPAPTAGRDLPAAQAFCGAGVSPAQSLAGRNPSPAAAPAPLRTPAPDSEDDHGPRSLTPITHPASLALPAPGLSSLSIAACSLPHALPGPSPALSTQPRPRGACPVHPDLHWALGETTNPTEPPLEAGDQGPNRNHQHSTARHEPPSHRRHQPLVNKPGAKSTKVRAGWGGGSGEVAELLAHWWDPDEATIGPFDLVSDLKTA